MIATGLDVVRDERPAKLRDRRVGLLCHPASVDGGLRHAIDVLSAAGVRLVRLFGPEHGVRGEAQDMIGVDDGRDRRTGLPTISLYGNDFASLSPPPGSLDDLDVLVIDLQDVGARYYTYVWTMALALHAAARAGVEVVVLDRPNPLGGVLIEGGPVRPGFASFVGLGSVPVRHGLTIGEVAMMARAGLGPEGGVLAQPVDGSIEVVAMRGWQRDMTFADCGLPWVLPSPNMPTVDTALVYPGMCLLEATNLSEGRGCTRPFEIVGAPWLDADRLCADLGAEDLPGVTFRPLTFRPTFHKFSGQACGGVQLHVRDRASFRPYRTGVAFLHAARRQDPSAFAWRREAYEFVADVPAIDLLTGDDAVRRNIESDRPLSDVAPDWAAFEAEFAARRRAHLLYPEAPTGPLKSG